MGAKSRKNKRDSQRQPTVEEYARRPQPGIAREFLDFLLYNKKWWLTPIILVLLLVGLLVILGSTGAAPFIYTMF